MERRGLVRGVEWLVHPVRNKAHITDCLPWSVPKHSLFLYLSHGFFLCQPPTSPDFSSFQYFVPSRKQTPRLFSIDLAFIPNPGQVLTEYWHTLLFLNTKNNCCEEGQSEVNLIKNSKMAYCGIFPTSIFSRKLQTVTWSGFSDPILVGWVDDKISHNHLSSFHYETTKSILYRQTFAILKCIFCSRNIFCLY